MKLSKGNPWGMVTGRISMSPEQALRTFGFVMSPTAQGIMIRHYKAVSISGHVRHESHISNYRDPTNNQTPAQNLMRARFGLFSDLAIAHKEDLIKPIWNPLSTARRHTRGHGYNEFRSVNMLKCRDITDLTSMLISDGELEPAELTSFEKNTTQEYGFQWNQITTKNGKPSDIAHAYVFYEATQTLHEIILEEIAHRVDGFSYGLAPTYPGTGNFYGFLFFENSEGLYSTSTALFKEENMVYVNRKNLTGYTKILTDFTLDDAMHDLDLSAVLPPEAANHLIYVFIRLQSTPAYTYIIFREKGELYTYNICQSNTQVAGQYTLKDGWVMCDSNRIIQYQGSTTGITGLTLTVKGYFIS